MAIKITTSTSDEEVTSRFLYEYQKLLLRLIIFIIATLLGVISGFLFETIPSPLSKIFLILIIPVSFFYLAYRIYERTCKIRLPSVKIETQLPKTYDLTAKFKRRALPSVNINIWILLVSIVALYIIRNREENFFILLKTFLGIFTYLAMYSYYKTLDKISLLFLAFMHINAIIMIANFPIVPAFEKIYVMIIKIIESLKA